MKKSNYILIITILIVVNGGLLYLYKTTAKNNSEIIIVARDERLTTNYLKNSININLDVNIQNENIVLTLDSSFFSANDFAAFEKIDYPKLVIRISDLNCQVCVDSLVLCIKPFLEKFRNHVVILSKYQNKHDLYLLKHMNQLTADVLNLKKEINLDIEKYNSPYIFLLNSDNKVVHPYISDKSYLKFTKFYLEKLSERYLTN